MLSFFFFFLIRKVRESTLELVSKDEERWPKYSKQWEQLVQRLCAGGNTLTLEIKRTPKGEGRVLSTEAGEGGGHSLQHFQGQGNCFVSIPKTMVSPRRVLGRETT